VKINIIVAVDLNGGIGLNGKIPWSAPADLAYFRRQTGSSTVIMGRKTHDSIVELRGRTLPGRRSIVISRSPELVMGAMSVGAPWEALTQCHRDSTVWIIGGGQIYKEFLAIADNVYMTVIREEFECDTFFPELDPKRWKKTRVSRIGCDESNPTMCFRVYEKVKPTRAFF
jgi:dihydrofolate reductase